MSGNRTRVLRGQQRNAVADSGLTGISVTHVSLQVSEASDFCPELPQLAVCESMLALDSPGVVVRLQSVEVAGEFPFE